MKDIFFDLDQSPKEWLRVELGKIFDISGGFAAPKGNEPFENGLIPFIRMQDLGRYHRTTNLVATKDKLNQNYVEKHRLKVIPKGSILIPRSGSVSLNHRAILGVDACVVSHICALVPKISVDVRFLYYALCNFDMRKIMKKTTGLDAITFQDLARVTVPLPSIPTQKIISDILQKAEVSKQKRQQANLMANKILQAVFLKMFGDLYNNKNNFEIRKLDDLKQQDTLITYGIVQAGPNTEDGVPYIKTGDIKDGVICQNNLSKTDRKVAEKYKRSEVHYGDLVYSIRATVGTVALLPKSLDGANLTQGTAKISPGHLVNKHTRALKAKRDYAKNGKHNYYWSSIS
jgi:type I restriction enzyme S subunit